MTDLKNFDLRRLDPTRLDLTRFDIRNIDLPSFDMPAEATQIVELARDVAFAGLGATVATVQKVDERRKELTDQVMAQVERLVAPAT